MGLNCEGLDCLFCLADGRFFVKLFNLTSTCCYNLASLDADYITALSPGQGESCPSLGPDSSDTASLAVLGSLAGLGLLVGTGASLYYFLKGRGRHAHLNTNLTATEQSDPEVAGAEGATEIQSLLGSSHYYDVPLSGNENRSRVETCAIVPVQQQQPHVDDTPLSRRRSFCGALRNSPFETENERKQQDMELERLGTWLILNRAATVTKTFTSREKETAQQFTVKTG